MKNEHTVGIVILVGAVLLFFMYKFTGAASNCSFADALLGKCGTS
jgi:hypothetical protein